MITPTARPQRKLRSTAAGDKRACDLRAKYVEGYEAGRAATVAQWADHLRRMNVALRAK